MGPVSVLRVWGGWLRPLRLQVSLHGGGGQDVAEAWSSCDQLAACQFPAVP